MMRRRVELVGGPRDGMLLDVAAPPPVLLEPVPTPCRYYTPEEAATPTPATIQVRSYRAERRVRVVAATVGDLLLPASALGHPLAVPVLDTDLDPADGHRYVLRE